MHLYFLTRGRDNVIQEWIKHLSSKWYEFDHKGRRRLFAANLKPVQLWEYVFPEEHADMVFNTVFDGQEDYGLGHGEGRWESPSNTMALKMLQKALGVKPIPKFDAKKSLKMAMPNREGMSILGIGIKEDKHVTDEETGTQHENL